MEVIARNYGIVMKKTQFRNYNRLRINKSTFNCILRLKKGIFEQYINKNMLNNT